MAEMSPSRDDAENQDAEDPSKRRMIGTVPDRLSQLPDSLIVDILCHLVSTKEMVRTCILSKRWQHIWTCVHSFDFSHSDYDEKDTLFDFVSFVTKTLTQYQHKLKKLKIDFQSENNLKKWLCPYFNLWIVSAVRRNAEDLEIDLSSGYSDWSEFVLPEDVFINSDFTKLTFRWCILEPSGAISWKSLANLQLYSVDLSEELIEHILSGSPSLEKLELSFCYGFDRLDITSTSVKKLVFCGYSPPKGVYDLDQIVEVNAPNILSLEMDGNFVLGKVVLLDMSSLVEAYLGYRRQGRWDSTNKAMNEDMLIGLIQSLHHVKELTVDMYKVLSRLEAKGCSFPSNMKFPVAPPCYSNYDSEPENWR